MTSRGRPTAIRDRGVFAQEAHALYPRAVAAGTDETTDGGDLAHPVDDRLQQIRARPDRRVATARRRTRRAARDPRRGERITRCRTTPTTPAGPRRRSPVSPAAPERAHESRLASPRGRSEHAASRRARRVRATASTSNPQQTAQQLAPSFVNRPNVFSFETSYDFPVGGTVTASGDPDLEVAADDRLGQDGRRDRMTRTLEPVDYWKLRAICSEASLCESARAPGARRPRHRAQETERAARRARVRPGRADVHARRRHADDHVPRDRVTRKDPPYGSAELTVSLLVLTGRRLLVYWAVHLIEAACGMPADRRVDQRDRADVRRLVLPGATVQRGYPAVRIGP